MKPMNRSNAQKIEAAWRRMQRERMIADNRRAIVFTGIVTWAGILILWGLWS